MDEQSVSANISKLVDQLNGELKAAYEMGLKVLVVDNGGFSIESKPAQVSVKVWRETILVGARPRLEPLRIQK